MLELEVHRACSHLGKIKVKWRRSRLVETFKGKLDSHRMNWHLYCSCCPWFGDEGVWQNPGSFLTKLNTHMWPRSQRSQRRILGKVKQVQTELLPHSSNVSQQIRDIVYELKNSCCFLCALQFPQESPLWPSLTGNIQENKIWEM